MIIVKDGQELDYRIDTVNIGTLNGNLLSVTFKVFKNNEFLMNYGINVSSDKLELLLAKWDIFSDLFKVLKEEEDTEYRDKIYRTHNNFITICDQLRITLGLPATKTKLSTPDSQALLNQLELVNPMAAVKFGLMLLGAANEITTIGSSWYHVVWHPEVEE